MNIPKIDVIEKAPPDPLHLGNMIWKPELLLRMPTARNCSNVMELTVQPSPPSKLEEEIAAAKYYAIDAFTDTKVMMLWKVMADYKPYTASEVAIMLEYYGFGKSTVSSMISQLNKHG